MHNLTVDGVHTYYAQAGDKDVLVHNCEITPNRGAYQQFMQEVTQRRLNAANSNLARTLGQDFATMSGRSIARAVERQEARMAAVNRAVERLRDRLGGTHPSRGIAHTVQPEPYESVPDSWVDIQNEIIQSGGMPAGG